MDELEYALTQTGLAFAHFGWSHAPARDYGVFAEDWENVLTADDQHQETAVQGTVDYFTRDASGAPKTAIEQALGSFTCSWRLESIQFEEDTGYIHYEWVVEVPGHG